jgi:polyhydroxyalkanoate synthesis regulator phasin
MPQPLDLSKYLDAGAEFVALTRAQARKRAKELVGQGQLAQEQVQGFVDELVDESRKRTDLLLEIVRKEIQRQVKTLGIATKEDLARLEKKLGKSDKGGGAKARKTSNGTSKQSTKKSAKPAGKKAGAKASTKQAAAKQAAKKSKQAAPKSSAS